MSINKNVTYTIPNEIAISVRKLTAKISDLDMKTKYGLTDNDLVNMYKWHTAIEPEDEE